MKNLIRILRYLASFILCIVLCAGIAAAVDDDTTTTDDGGGWSAGSCICCIVLLLLIVVPVVIGIILAVMATKKMGQRRDAVTAQIRQSAPPPYFAPPPGWAAPPLATPAQQVFRGNEFRVDRKFLSLIYSYYVYDGAGRLIAYSTMKPFRLKEDIRIYSDESKSYELMSIQQEQILDITGTFNVFDSQSRQFLGTLKRSFLRSFIQDQWLMLNAYKQQIGQITEDSLTMALVRRLIPYGNLIPNVQFINYMGHDMGIIAEKFRVIGNEYTMSLMPGTDHILDRRLAIACLIMMAQFENNRKGR